MLATAQGLSQFWSFGSPGSVFSTVESGLYGPLDSANASCMFISRAEGNSSFHTAHIILAAYTQHLAHFKCMF